MSDLCVVLAPVALVYGGATVGTAAAHLFRVWCHRRGRTSTCAEATWTAALPGIAVLLLPLVLFSAPPLPGPADALHRSWHEWEEAVRDNPPFHAVMHALDLLLALWAVVGLFRLMRVMAQTHSFVRRLREIAGPPAGSPTEVCLIPASRPLCLTAGFWRPTIFLTAGLQEQLLPEDLSAVLAHEAAHVRRRDPLTSLVLHSLHALIPLPGARLLLQDWERAAERACDREAAVRLGSPHAMARALVRVVRLLDTPSLSPGVVPFASRMEDVEGRVRALLGRPDRVRSGFVVLLASALALTLADGVIPHLVELLVRH